MDTGATAAVSTFFYNLLFIYCCLKASYVPGVVTTLENEGALNPKPVWESSCQNVWVVPFSFAFLFFRFIARSHWQRTGAHNLPHLSYLFLPHSCPLCLCFRFGEKEAIVGSQFWVRHTLTTISNICLSSEDIRFVGKATETAITKFLVGWSTI